MESNMANDVPLSPVSFLQRMGDVFRDVVKIVDPDGQADQRTWTGAEFKARADRIAGSVRGFGVQKEVGS